MLTNSLRFLVYSSSVPFMICLTSCSYHSEYVVPLLGWMTEFFPKIIPVRFPMQSGIEPIKSLFERSKICSAESWHSCEGIFPLNLFCLSLRICMEDEMFPIHEGIIPDKWFSPRSKIKRCFKFIKDDGNPP
ncbi:hypothetical protein JHK82_027986 [Glycine max]|nr:hypothetical protein JHK82_027986 [Glycine max]